MNLIQVQDDLQSLPNDDRTMQALMAYANGANPQVPPYLALGELNRRKQLMERSQQAQQAQQAQQNPQGTVKDQIEQSAGVMALQQQRNRETMEQLFRGRGAQPGMTPRGIEQSAPVQGQVGNNLAQLMSYPAAQYRSGGIVSFAAGTQGFVGDDEDVRQMMDAGYFGNEDEERRREELIRRMSEAQDAGYGAEDGSAKALLMRAMQERARRSEQRPKFVDPLAEREKIIRERPELAAAKTDTSAEMLRRLDEMDALRRAEFAKQREELAKSRPGILQLLGQAAAGTRGQRGASALAATLGGYADLSQRQDVAAMEQERGLRGRELELQQARMQVLNKIDEEKRARAEGDLKLAMKAKMDHEKILRDYNTSDNQLFGRELSAIGQLATTEERERGMLEREGLRQEALTDRAQLLRGREALAQRIAALRAEGKNAEADRLSEAYRSMGGSTADVGMANAARNQILAQIKIQQNIIDSKGSGRATPQEKERAKLEKQRLEGVLAQLPIPGLPAGSASPAAVPAANSSAPLGTAANPIKLK